MWGAGSSEEIAEMVYKHDERELINELEARGYTVTKEKVPVSEPSKAHTQALNNNISSKNDNTSQSKTWNGTR